MEELEDRRYVNSGRFETGSVYTILNRMEGRGLLLSENEKSVSGRVRRVYNLTPTGTDALKRGLERILRQKRVMDELSEYYVGRFGNGEEDSIPDVERSEER
jgi:DNA-binding PadR family transcriptional regulator